MFIIFSNSFLQFCFLFFLMLFSLVFFDYFVLYYFSNVIPFVRSIFFFVNLLLSTAAKANVISLRLI